MARPNRPGERDISRFLRLTRTGAFYLVIFLIVTAASIWLALQVAPLQTVSAAGQTAQVGAAVPSFEPVGLGRTRPVRPGDADQAAVRGPDPPAAQAHPHHHQPAGRSVAALGQPAHAGAEPQPAAGAGLDALLRVGDAHRGRLRRGRADRGGRSAQAVVPEDGEDRRRRPRRGNSGERRRRAADRVQHARGTAQRQDPRRPGRRRPAHRAAASGHPAAARRAGGGDRRLHRGRRGQPGRRERQRPGPRLRPQQRVLRRGPGHGEQLERAEPGLQRRDRAERPARRPGARQRAGRPVAAGRGGAGHARQGDHRQRRRGRRGVVHHDPALRGQRGVQRQGVLRLLHQADRRLHPQLLRAARRPGRRCPAARTS